MYGAVLVAVDLEDEAGLALLAQRAIAMAGAMQCSLHLAYVRTALPHSYLQNLPKNWEAAQRSETEALLRRYAQTHGFDTALSGVHAPVGSISREVVSLASSLGIDCIVVAAHRMDLVRLLLGNNATAIARDAPCDVLVVRE